MKLFVGTNVRQTTVVIHLIILICTIQLCAISCDAHGRLIEPPSRASAWRYGFSTPPDYNDHELYCGGFTRQWKHNDGKCGECGDAWDLPQPRPHEYGGQWGQGIIVRHYKPEEKVTLRVELTASHMGYFEFRLCPVPNAAQDCFDQNLLNVLGGTPFQQEPEDLETRFYPRNGSRIYDIRVQLPNLNCTHCVLQWRYIAGNNWGMCADGTHGAVGCGPQEEFRSCSDVSLGHTVSRPSRPLRPTLRPTQSTTIYTTSTETSQQQSDSFNYVPLVVLIICLFLAVFIFLLWYLRRKNNTIFIQCRHYFVSRMSQQKPQTVCTQSRTTLSSITSHPALGNNFKPSSSLQSNVTAPSNVPVPPPRAKRQARIKEIGSDESSIA